MSPKYEQFWQIWIDTGGTFTDCVARDPSGALHRVKVLSSSALRGFVEEPIDARHLRVSEKWQASADFIRGFRFRLLDRSHPDVFVQKYDPDSGILGLTAPIRVKLAAKSAFEVCSCEEAPILAARLVTCTSPGEPLPLLAMRLATTIGTNALLERKGVPVALFITRGFGDLLLIGTQQRPELFALEIHKPKPLYHAVVEVEERIAADGTVLQPIQLEALGREINGLIKKGIRVAAVVLMHSYRHAIHEKQLAEFLRRHGFKHVSCSSDLAPFIKLLHRAETAVVDAYLAPVIEDYLRRVLGSLTSGRLHVMTSAGGLVEAHAFHAKDSLLSGPAGGVVGAALAGRRSGYDKVIAFDMGGTSTDVARYDGDYEYVFEHQVGEAHLVAPALAIESVAAGGGSICSFDGHRLLVGPESAGARPGPACYGAGGPLTLTDANLLLGRLDPEHFDIPITLEPATRILNTLCKTIEKQTGKDVNRDSLLEGFLDIANERMADAIRRISLRQGYEPRDYVLVAFGGAGGQHACSVAQKLGITTILVPQDASLLSALGLGHAVVERFVERQILQPLNAVEEKVSGWISELASEAIQEVQAEGVRAEEIEVRRQILNLRFLGQDSVLSVEFDESIPIQKAFELKYSKIFGHHPERRTVELESMRVVASSKATADVNTQKPTQLFDAEAETFTPLDAYPTGFTRARFNGEWQEVPVYQRSRLSPGACLTGPALVFERHSATVVEAGWKVQVDGTGALVVKFQ